MLELTEIKRTNIRPGDVLVLRYPGLLTAQQRTAMQEQCRSLPELLNVPIFVLENGIDIEIVHQEQTP